jgi:glycosyltransferase involved in cell wall biosynthesis
MKNIVFVIESLNLGGAETGLVNFLNNLDYSKYNVDLILFTKENFFIDFVPKKVNVIIIKPPKVTVLDRIKYKIFRIFHSNSFHNAQIFWSIVGDKYTFFDKKYDIAHAHNQGFVTYYVAKYINADKKFAWINIDYQMVKYNIQFDYPFYKEYNKVIAISDEVKRGFLEEVKKINGKIDTTIIKLFADETLLMKRIDEKPAIIFDKSKINIVTTCRLSKQKGLHLAVESCKKLLDKGHLIHWYIVGEGSERKFLENLIAQYNIANHFTLMGKTLNPFPFMNQCDIYVQTSLFEGWGLTLIEAILLKKCVVTTNFPTAYNIVENNKTGLICEMNSDAIVENIEKYLTNISFKESIMTNLKARKNTDKEASLQNLEAISV